MYDMMPVPFRGATLGLIDANGNPYTAMRPIVEGMGLEWSRQASKIRDRFGPVVADLYTTGADGKKYEMLCLPLKKLPGWLYTINPNQVRADLQEKIRTYQNECDEVLWAHWAQNRVQLINPGAIQHKANSSGYILPDVITTKVRAAIIRRARVLANQCEDRVAVLITAKVREVDFSSTVSRMDMVNFIDGIGLSDLDVKFPG